MNKFHLGGGTFFSRTQPIFLPHFPTFMTHVTNRSSTFSNRICFQHFRLFICYQTNFIPINLYEEELIHDAEVHTRELQVEEGLELYKQALSYQQAGDRENAHKEYDKLFNLEVINLTPVSNCYQVYLILDLL